MARSGQHVQLIRTPHINKLLPMPAATEPSALRVRLRNLHSEKLVQLGRTFPKHCTVNYA